MGELCDIGAAEMRRLMAERAISPVEAVESCFSRIAAVNPAVNAVVTLDEKGQAKMQPFITGFMTDEKADPPMWGRPVDLLVMKDGSVLVSDDWNGAIYRITYGKKVAAQ